MRYFVGSSLVVYPAAGFPAMAKQNDAGLVIVNRDPTDLDRIADAEARMAAAEEVDLAAYTQAEAD